MRVWRRGFRTGSWGLLAAVAVVLMATTTATSMPGSAFDGRTATVAAKKVCGTLTADATYDSEVSLLGVDHACEHLKGRQFVETKAGRAAMKGASLAATSDLATTDPAVIGSWTNATNPGTKTIAISAVMLHTGKVLIFGGKYKSTDKNTAAYLFDPTTGTGHEVPAPAAVFCGAITPLADGRVLSVGGTDVVPQGIVDLWLFDPVTEQWVRQPDTPLGRYYPTATKLADGRILIAAGTEVDGTTPNPTVEVYTPPEADQTMGTVSLVGTSHAT